MLASIYCIIGLIVFVLNVMFLPEVFKELAVVPNSLIVITFIVSFFAGVLWPVTLIYGICNYEE